MGDSITEGDEVELVSALGPRFGEIWAYLDDRGQLVVHRYVGSRRGRFVFRGDARSSTDRLVPEARLVGKVTRRSHAESIERVRRIDGVRKVAGWRLAALKKRLLRQ